MMVRPRTILYSGQCSVYVIITVSILQTVTPDSGNPSTTADTIIAVDSSLSNNTTSLLTETGGCYPGWKEYGDFCYLHSGHSTGTFEGAHNICRSALDSRPGAPRADLVSISGSLENDLLVSFLKNYGPAFWIGLRASSGHFAWTDDSPYFFSNWDVKHVYISVSEASGELPECVALVNANAHTGLWRITRCTEKNGYICKAKRDPRLTSVIPDVDPRCPKGFRFRNGVCFLVKQLREPLDWDQAKLKCQKFGGVLATIRDIYENTQFRVALNLLDPTGTAEAWLSGGNRNFRRIDQGQQNALGGSVAVDQTNNSSYENGRNCAYMNALGRWFLTDCSQRLSYALCENRLDHGPSSETTPTAILTNVTTPDLQSSEITNVDNGPIISTTLVAPITDEYTGLSGATISWMVFGMLLSASFVGLLAYAVYTGRSVFNIEYFHRMSRHIKRSFNLRRHNSTDHKVELTLADISIA